jgi:hypothetical protein
MGPLVVLLGNPIKSDSAKGIIRLVTPKGDVLTIKEADVVSTSSVDAGGELKRYAIGADAVVTAEFSGASLRGLDVSIDSILKWVDDGGTISKSRDDT